MKAMHLIRLLMCCALLALSRPGFGMDKVIVDAPEDMIDRRNDYTTVLLRAILDKTERQFGGYTLSYAPEYMNRERLFDELKKGKTVNVTAKATQPKWENDDLHTIRIPVDKGISAYRLFLINRDDQAKFSSITSIEELKRLTLGVGYAWSTRTMFESQGFSLVSAGSWEGLYKMLDAHRFDYLPRALSEIFIEYDDRHTRFPDMSIENALIIYAPLPKYFFVSPQDPALAKRIETGFQAMIKDGSFDRLFMTYHQRMIERTHFCSRRLLRFDNPQLSPLTPLNRPEYWYDPYTNPRSEKDSIACRR
jgi:hypothetical protein